MNKAVVNGMQITSSLDAEELAFIGDMSLDTTASTLSGAINEHESDISTLNSNLTNYEYEAIAGGGNFSISMQRMGYLRILNLYNGNGAQSPISIQLKSKDIPRNNVQVGNWLCIDSSGTFASRFANINSSTGILTTYGEVFRGGWVVVYIAKEPA